MKKLKQRYQGDIPLIKGIEKQDLNTKELPKTGLVVEVGEVTNHEHRVIPQDGAVISYAEYLDGWYMDIKKGSAVITHPEHKEIKFDKGIHFFGKQYEYDEQTEYRKVAD